MTTETEKQDIDEQCRLPDGRRRCLNCVNWIVAGDVPACVFFEGHEQALTCEMWAPNPSRRQSGVYD
ncbi:MAG: hypothetical protein FWE67_02495 [Planctomycetaceae bacterium]|nr:hypothetical protein [Planctomycetaceae bacterium]